MKRDLEILGKMVWFVALCRRDLDPEISTIVACGIYDELAGQWSADEFVRGCAKVENPDVVVGTFAAYEAGRDLVKLMKGTLK